MISAEQPERRQWRHLCLRVAQCQRKGPAQRSPGACALLVLLAAHPDRPSQQDLKDTQEDLVAAWQVVRAAMGDHDVPSTLMGVTVLGYDDQLVEVEGVAAVRDGSGIVGVSSDPAVGPAGPNRG